MERRLFAAAVILAWLALPLTAWNYSQAWDRLPMRMAVHFNANWQPNGWTTREGSRTLALGMTAMLLVVFTLASYSVRRKAPSSFAPWVLLVVFYVVLGIVYHVNAWLVERNFNPRPTPFSRASDPGSQRTESSSPPLRGDSSQARIPAGLHPLTRQPASL